MRIKEFFDELNSRAAESLMETLKKLPFLNGVLPDGCLKVYRKRANEVVDGSEEGDWSMRRIIGHCYDHII